ncbi:hypothetical protein SAMN05421858_0497 [Haladaptatus litoreus]|uniref:Uncharacterized protein n=1 Tax=Haladaptatus litoreus TaxID=553468 RepID=A0A1N6VV10_9EURY|nr:hypothetical protein [Haladaptatus litoreus]SIQ81662.1 hypothetical protein SAMN05421858_0497 [Haladaptatus litoreus]
MSTEQENQPADVQQTEYTDGAGRVVMLYDPDNADAWIRSCVTYPVEP